MELTTVERRNPLLEPYARALNHQCSRFAPSAHSWPENLLALRLIYHVVHDISVRFTTLLYMDIRKRNGFI